MSTSLILGVAGAALLGPVGLGLTTAGTGWLIGSTIGSLLGGSKDTNTQGPRLNDLTVQASTYGQMVPVVYGAYKINGNVIFATDLREVSSTVSQSGKGGPTASQTTYTYNCDIAISLCDNTIASIRKIFNNGKLIFDASTGADIQTVIASDIRANSMKLYLGTQDQLPDPTIEAALGVGNVPAYRGTAYLVFSQLDCPNGQIPQLSFEVLASSSIAAEIVSGEKQTLSFASSSISGVQIISYVSTSAKPTPIYSPFVTFESDKFYYIVNAIGINYQARILKTNYLNNSPVYTGSRGISDEDMQAFDEVNPVTGKVVVVSESGNTIRRFETRPFVDASGLMYSWSKFGENIAFLYNNNGSVGCNVLVFNLISGALISKYQQAPALPKIYITTTYAWFFYQSGNDRRLQVHRLSDMVQTFNGPLTKDAGLFSNNTSFAIHEGDQLRALVQSAQGTKLSLYSINPNGTSSLIAQDAQYTSRPSFIQDLVSNSVVYNVKGSDVYGIKVDNTGVKISEVTPFIYRMAAISNSSVTIASVITDIAARAGLPINQLDVTALTDTVQGYALTNVSTARANIDPLLKTFFIDPVKADNKVKFRPRATLASAATITFDDLGAVQDGTKTGEPLPLQRTQEDDLPRSLAISYINPGADYQTGTETARRIVTTSINDQTMQLAVVMTSDRAATVANALMYNDWSERNKRSLKVSRKFAALDAGDVVTVEYPRTRFAPYRITRATDTGVTIDLDVVDFDGPVYTVQAKGSPASAASAQTSISLLSPSRFEILNTPILRDIDDNPGAYVAIAPLNNNWPGAALYVGTSKTNGQFSGSVTSGAVIGFCDSKMGGWRDGIIDQINTLLVTIGPGQLYSVTREDVLSRNANAALIGDEIVQFTTATLITGRQYLLSGFLRGLRGTEAARGTQAVGDKFVLLDSAALLRPQTDTAAINENRIYKAVTIGQQLNVADAKSGTSTGRGLRPFSPVNPRVIRTPEHTIRLTWDRRTRLADNWLIGAVPLGEAQESYEIDVFVKGKLTRTLKSNFAQVDYGINEQNVDNSPDGAVTSFSFAVYQISDKVGRGDSLARNLVVFNN